MIPSENTVTVLFVVYTSAIFYPMKKIIAFFYGTFGKK
jgi:hypothetical protein